MPGGLSRLPLSTSGIARSSTYPRVRLRAATPLPTSIPKSFEPGTRALSYRHTTGPTPFTGGLMHRNSTRHEIVAVYCMVGFVCIGFLLQRLRIGGKDKKKYYKAREGMSFCFKKRRFAVTPAALNLRSLTQRLEQFHQVRKLVVRVEAAGVRQYPDRGVSDPLLLQSKNSVSPAKRPAVGFHS
jgi:hypothetical protein